jgi:hypothetical protein
MDGRAWIDRLPDELADLAAIAAFYDTVIAPSEQISFEIERSYLVGDEVADVGVIRTILPGGRHQAVVRGVYTYRSDGAGRLAALRAYWEFDTAEITEVTPWPHYFTWQTVFIWTIIGPALVFKAVRSVVSDLTAVVGLVLSAAASFLILAMSAVSAVVENEPVCWPLSAASWFSMFVRSAVSVLTDAALTVMWVRLVSDVRNELMWTHAALLAAAGEAESDGLAGGLFGMSERAELDVQPETSIAPPKASPATAQAARRIGRLGPANLVIVSLVMAPIHTQRRGHWPHPKRAIT